MGLNLKGILDSVKDMPSASPKQDRTRAPDFAGLFSIGRSADARATRKDAAPETASILESLKNNPLAGQRGHEVILLSGATKDEIVAAKPSPQPEPRKSETSTSLTPYAGTSFRPRSEAMNPATPIETIYLKATALGLPSVAKELKEIGQRRGFDVVDSAEGLTPDLWAEDNAVVMRDRSGQSSLLVSSVTKQEFQRASVALADSDPTGRIPSLETLGRAFDEGHATTVAATARRVGWDVRATPLAIEGGNLLMTENKKGEAVGLIGRNSVLLNWHLLKQKGQLPAAEVERVQKAGGFDKALAGELQALATSRDETLSPQDANRQAAEIEVTRRMLARSLNLKPENLVSIEQQGFHIDMETRPLGKGAIMVSDLRKSVERLDTAIAAAEAKPAPDDRAVRDLRALRERTLGLIRKGGQDRLDAKTRTLEQAGFSVVREAVNFGGIGEVGRIGAGQVDVNFANGISAVDRDGKPYFITNRSRSAELNEQFERDMKARGIAVEWTSTGSLLEYFGGLDCITLHKQGK